MDGNKHTVLLVDDEENILHSLKRLLRKEEYCLLTGSSGVEGLRILEENDVHLVISDQRMPGMSGIEFFAAVKEHYPDTIRIILSGYTDVDSITESINKGHIYKFFVKPWNDQSLKLEIRQALEQYDLIQTNRKLHEKVLEQNEELIKINENLEILVQERTTELEIQKQALELSREILEDLPIPIIGISVEGMIVMVNQEVQALSDNGKGIKLGKNFLDYFSPDVEARVTTALETSTPQVFRDCQLAGASYDMNCIPLSGRFRGKGVVLVLNPLAAG